VEELLIEVLHLDGGVPLVERDELRERPRLHLRRRGGEIGVERDLELREEDGVLIALQAPGGGLVRHVHELGARLLEQRAGVGELGVERGVLAELSAENAEALAAERVGVERGRVVALVLVGSRRSGIIGIAARHDGEQHRHVDDRVTDRPGRVLRARDRDDVAAREQPHGGPHPDDAHDGRGAEDRAGGVGAERRGAQARRHRGPAPRARAAGRAVERMRVAREASHRAPAADRLGGAHVRPLAQVGLAEDERAGLAQASHDGGVAARDVVLEGERARGGRDRLGRLDVVFDENGNPVERPRDPPRARSASSATACVTRQRVLEREHRVEQRPGCRRAGDAMEIRVHERDAVTCPVDSSAESSAIDFASTTSLACGGRAAPSCGAAHEAKNPDENRQRRMPAPPRSTRLHALTMGSYRYHETE
jgi:hypothetical protein